MSRLFEDKLNNTEIDGAAEDFSSIVLPFENKSEPNPDKTATKPADTPKKEPVNIPTHISSLDPLNALRESVKKTVRQGKLEEQERAAEKEASENTAAKPVRKKTSSLLAKCMPYIYDDEGNSYAEEKPDYTLESVEDIIESAEKRASEKIARMYNLKPSEVESIGAGTPEKTDTSADATPTRVKLRLEETSIKKPLRIGEVGKAVTKFDTVQIPKISTTLFDDFSARRTDIIAEENITTTYSEQGGINSTPDLGATRVMPDLRSEDETQVIYEDILSHTRPVNVVDISSTSQKKTPAIKSFNEPAPTVEVDDFKGKEDITRIGSELKLNMVSAKIKTAVTFILTLLAASVHFPFMSGIYSSPLLPTSIALVSFALAMLINLNVFASFKGAFTSKAKIEFPLALAGTLMTAYIIWSIIGGSYPYEPALLPMISFLVYDYCSYKKASAIFSNFKLVALRKVKTAVTLIDDTAINSAMARSVIQGEILTASQTETDEIKNFLRHTLSDRPCGGKINVFSSVALAITGVIGVGVGVSYASASLALLSAACVMSLIASPSLFIADMLPFAGISEKLRRLRAALCSKYSAERIEEINALVISSSDVFPAGSIKLFNISPLSANNLDDTITAAAAVAESAKSPLFPVFKKMVGGDYELPESDSVKYEENLGISGWVGDDHIMIGNRSLMQSHGVRVPDLGVDRKILHKGFFPVYVACNQRACALLMIKYTAEYNIERELCSLADKGITLLIDNCDPNITEQMLCDYFGLYPDIVKILDHNGAEKHREATAHAERVSAHGFHKGTALSFLSVISQSFRLRTLSNVLYILHIICTVLICLMFAGMSLNGAHTLMSAAICALCQLCSTVITLVAYYVGK